MQYSTNLSLLFLQCPVPAWPDSVHGRAPAPASRPTRAPGAAHTPMTCSVAGYTRAAPRRSAGAHTPTSPWRVFPAVTWTTSSQSQLKWHVRAHSALNPLHLNQTIPHYLHFDSLPLSCPFICTIFSWNVTGPTSMWLCSTPSVSSFLLYPFIYLSILPWVCLLALLLVSPSNFLHLYQPPPLLWTLTYVSTSASFFTLFYIPAPIHVLVSFFSSSHSSSWDSSLSNIYHDTHYMRKTWSCNVLNENVHRCVSI